METLLEKLKNTVRKESFRLLIKEFHLKTALEVGVLEACFSTDLLEIGIEHLTGVDINNCPNAWNLQKEYPERYRFMQFPSPQAASQFPNNHFDLIYLDDCHTNAHVFEELKAYYPKIKPGKILAGHDFMRFTSDEGEVFGVIEAVTLFALQNNLDLYVTGTTATKIEELIRYGYDRGDELNKRAKGKHHNFVEAPSWWLIRRP